MLMCNMGQKETSRGKRRRGIEEKVLSSLDQTNRKMNSLLTKTEMTGEGVSFGEKDYKLSSSMLALRCLSDTQKAMSWTRVWNSAETSGLKFRKF